MCRKGKSTEIESRIVEFPLWLSDNNPTSVHEDMGSIPGLTQWVGIWCCHELWCRSQIRLGSGVALAVVQAGSFSSNSLSSLGTSMCPRCNPKKRKKKKEKECINSRTHTYTHTHMLLLYIWLDTVNRDYILFFLLFLSPHCCSALYHCVFTS